jgi:hypothetical protein
MRPGIDAQMDFGKKTAHGYGKEAPDAAGQSSLNRVATAIPGATDVINGLTVRQPATLTMTDNKK